MAVPYSGFDVTFTPGPKRVDFIQTYSPQDIVNTNTRTGVTISDAGGGAFDITVAGSLSADANPTASAAVWVTPRDAFTDRPVTDDPDIPGGRYTRLWLEFETLPADGSNIGIYTGWTAISGPTPTVINQNVMYGGADFADAGGRRVAGGRSLPGIPLYSYITDPGSNNSAFNVTQFSGQVNVATNSFINGVGTTIGLDSMTNKNPGVSPWDIVANIPGNVGLGDGLCILVRCLGTTSATSCRVRLYSSIITFNEGLTTV